MAVCLTGAECCPCIKVMVYLKWAKSSGNSSFVCWAFISSATSASGKEFTHQERFSPISSPRYTPPLVYSPFLLPVLYFLLTLSSPSLFFLTGPSFLSFPLLSSVHPPTLLSAISFLLSLFLHSVLFPIPVLVIPTSLFLSFLRLFDSLYLLLRTCLSVKGLFLIVVCILLSFHSPASYIFIALSFSLF